MTCLVKHLEDIVCIMCRRSDQVYQGHGVVRFCAHCSISWDPMEDGKSLDNQKKAIILSEDQDGELPEDMVERMGMLIGGITVVFGFERRLADMMIIPEALFAEDQVKHLSGRHDQRTHGRGGTKDTVTLAAEYKAPPMDQEAAELFDKWGPGDNYVMAQELGADVNLAHFQKVNSQWTQGADQDAKYDIEGILKGDPQVRALTLYDLYSSQDKEMKQTFSDWAETPQTFYRGGGRSEPFMSFAPSEAVARGESASDQIAVLTIKPSQLLGTGMTGSNEVYVANEAIEQYQYKHLPGHHKARFSAPMGGSISGGSVFKEKLQEGKATEHVWRSLITTFSPVMRLIHEAMRMDSEDTKAMADELFKARKAEFNDAISDYVSQLGCGGMGDLKTNTELKFFREDSDHDAQNITTTYNLNLAEIIQNIRLTSPRANRHIYSRRLQKWETDRKLWKSTQIALWTTMTARDQALKSFGHHNNLKPKVELMPKLAKEPICQGWVNRGAVPFEVAVNNKSPYHPNCIHFWKPTFEKIEDCTNLWKG